jgi:Uncharacterized conserved protein
MISQIDLSFFKCFEALSLPLAPLTLLTGANSSGKSSVLQSLVLLNQTMREHEWSKRLLINGNLLKLGTVLDVVDKVHGRFEFSISVTVNGSYCSWTFIGNRTDISFSIERIKIGNTLIEKPSELHYLLPLNNKDIDNKDVEFISSCLPKLTYITAERIGPREFYPLEDQLEHPVVGRSGEYSVSLLFLKKDDHVLQQLEIKNIPPTLLHQVEARMQQFFPGCRLSIEQVPRINAVTIGFRTSEDTDFHRPINVGFGFSQVLPIVVAALSAKKDDVLLIENPEVHLHPAGQALMGDFLAQIAQSGVQVILETHSDHILNGVRRAVKSQRIGNENVALHFFSPRGSEQSQVISPQIDSTGNIDYWPDGFFDQFDKDTNYFAGWGD